MTTLTRSATVTSADGTTIGYHTLGAGPAVIVVGGALRTAQDYLAFGKVLAHSFTVHLMDRRGRGTSGPQGADYSIDKECQDLAAVAARTGATRVFGHSYGGLVALETARRSSDFTQVAVYEPGISIHGSIPAGWLPRYEHLLSRGDTRGAFACMAQGAGFAPRATSKMPLWCLRAALRVAIPGRQWQRMEPLLQTNLAEHQQVLRLDGTATRYAAISSQVLLLGGSKSPAFITTQALQTLNRIIAHSAIDILDGLGHTAPDEKAPEFVAERVNRFFRSPEENQQSPE